MGRNKRDRHKGSTDGQKIDLLGAAFNLPTRRDIELAGRQAAQAHQVKIQYQGNEINIGGLQVSDSSDGDADDPEPVSLKSQRHSNPPPRRQPEQRRSPPQRQKPNKSQKSISNQQPPSRKTRQKLTKSSSTNSSRVFSNVASSIPASATFPPSRANYVVPPPDTHSSTDSTSSVPMSTQPPRIQAVEAQPQHYFQPPFTFAAIPAAPQMPRYVTPRVTHPFASMQNIAQASTTTTPRSESPVTTTSRHQASTGSLAHQVQNIQAEIDQKIVIVSANPNNGILKQELVALQAKLNAALNAVLSPKQSTRASREPDGLAAHNSSITNKSGSGSPPERSTRDKKTESSHSVQVQDPEAISSEVLDLDSQSNILPTTRRDASPEREIRHHLCSGCGNVRSSRFHEKHPIVSGEKPVLNYYESCQKANRGGNLLERYHFCFRCGIARSKEFQRQNPRSRGDFLIPNYCGRCTLEIQSIVDITEASVVDFKPEVSSKSSRSLETSRIFGRARRDPPGLASLRDMRGYGAQPKTLYPSSSNSTGETSEESGPFQLRSKKKKAFAKSLNLMQPSSQPSQANPTPATPYYPERRISSAQRRAQRSPLANMTGGYASPFSSGSSAQTYRAPYVEDVQSPIPPESTSTYDLPLRSNSNSKVDVLKVMKDSRDKTSSLRQSRQSQHNQYYSSSAENSDYNTLEKDDGESVEDLRSPLSEESAQSSGHKTAKFRPNAEPYSSDSPVPIEGSTCEDIYVEDTHPDIMQSMPDIHGSSPLVPNTKRPSSALETVHYKESNSYEGHYNSAHGQENDIPDSKQPLSQDATENFEHQEQERRWKGAFAKRERSETGAWARHTTAVGDNQTSPTEAGHPFPSSPASAGLPGFPPSVSESYSRLNEAFQNEDAEPPLRTSKGAFSSTTFKSTLYTDGTGIHGLGSPHSTASSPRAKDCTGAFSSPWESSFRTDGPKSEFPRTKPSESSFRQSSAFGGYSSRFDSDCHTMRDDESFTHGGCSDFSRSSSNPYYVPRKSTFADMKNRGGFGRRSSRTREWWDDQRSKTHSRKSHDWFPEPIIEEPSSPISLPVQRAMLLEFHDDHPPTPSPVPPLCESSTDSEEADEPDISEIKEFLDEESDEESGEGNEPQKTTTVARFYRNFGRK